MFDFSPVLVVLFIFVVYLVMSINILAEYERGVVFRLGKLLPAAQGAGRRARLRAARSHGAREHADGRHGRAVAGRHHAR